MNLFTKIKNFQIVRGGIPFAIFLLCALTFGPLITQLGFYWDDWTVIQVIHLKESLWEFYAYNRPASAWTQAFFAPVLGTSTLNWHLFAEGVWVLTAIACWWMLDQLWPTHKRQTAAMAMLFAVHPLFLLHPIAVAFSQQYLTFLPFFISMGAMLAAVRNPARFWLWTGVGLLTMAVHMLTMEYFWGLELARPLLIWLVLRDSTRGQGRKAKLLQMLRVWGPYVGVLIGVVLWRMVFVTFDEGDPNELALLNTIAQTPLVGLGQLAQTVLYDMVYMLVHRWAETVNLEWFNLQDEFLWVVWGVALFVAVGATLFLRRLKDLPAPSAPRDEQWQIIGVGLWMILVGGLAVWLPGRSVVNGLYDDRFALPLLPGVVILTVGGIGFFAQPQVRAAFAGILLGLAVAMHLRVQNDYRWDWVNQERAFWQLSWRAPALAENTVVFSDGTLFRYTGGYPTASALNVLYPQQDVTPRMGYWFLELDRGYVDLLEEMIATEYPIEAEFRQFTFATTSRQSLVVYYEPDDGNCLWVLSGLDEFRPGMPVLTRDAVPLSNLNQILPDQPATPPDAAVFGPEPAHTWCYFYQKAELARQQEDWATIVALADESVAKGISPNNRVEWLPFVDAFAHTGNWDRALELSVDALRYAKSTRNLFCPVWRSFEEQGLDAPAGTFAEAYARLECDGRD